MTVLKMFLSSCISLILLFLLCRMIGQRQIGQMSMFDYINSICIGSAAMELAINPDQWTGPLVAMFVYGLATALINVVTCKSIRLRKALNGRPLILYSGGTLYRANLYRAKLDLNEFLTQCRIAGYFDLGQLETVLLETSGQFSFLPRGTHRPLNPADLQIQSKPQYLKTNLILDGELLPANLKASGFNEEWLRRKLHAAGFSKISEVFLATCDPDGQFTAYRMTDTPAPADPFE